MQLQHQINLLLYTPRQKLSYKMIKYEIVKNAFFSDMIKKTDEDGKESWIPTDPANQDYQAYLEHLTENPTEDSE